MTFLKSAKFIQNGICIIRIEFLLEKRDHTIWSFFGGCHIFLNNLLTNGLGMADPLFGFNSQLDNIP